MTENVLINTIRLWFLSLPSRFWTLRLGLKLVNNGFLLLFRC